MMADNPEVTGPTPLQCRQEIVVLRVVRMPASHRGPIDLIEQ